MVKNKGFTFYELLIVITVIALMAGFTTITIGTVYRNNAKRAADSISSSIKSARTNALSKGKKSGYVNFYNLNGDFYVYVGEEILPSTNPVNFSTQKWELVCSNMDYIGIGFDNGAGYTQIPLNPGALATFGFKQSTGECLGLKFPYASETTVYPSDLSIHIEKGNSDAYVEVGRYGIIETK